MILSATVLNTTNKPKENTMKLITVIIVATLAAATWTTANADDGCTTVDYQGAPADLCPPPETDPTNCYTGWYQGAPIEVCMPTGVSLPDGTTYNGEPVVIHNATGYVPASTGVVTGAAPISAVTVGTYFDK